MKTTITMLFVLSASVFSLRAQIPNGNFESWTGGEPDSWLTFNSAYPGVSNQVTDAHNGSSAIRLNVISFFGSNIGGAIYSGDLISGPAYFPVSSAPVAIHGWYKFHPTVSTEELILLSFASYQGTSAATAVSSITNSTNVYTEFIADYYYTGAPMSDSVSIFIALSDPDSSRMGTYAIIDDLTFGPAGPTIVDELSNDNLLEPCSPNPATQQANIIYRINGNSKVNLELFDVVGHKVMSLLDGIYQTTGRYKIPTDVSNLPDGIYFCKLDVNGVSHTQKLVVSKSVR